MSFYEVTEHGLSRQHPKTFSNLQLYERGDIQRLLLADISPIGEDLMVIAEEFSQWEDAHRRIDLLALDRQGQLVVIELKRTEDGGHMKLQALRYAAMVSSMDFADVLAAFEAHRAKLPLEGDITPREELEAFLDASGEGEEPAIAGEVRIVLVSADFGKEITTAVLWLNGFEGMDIRCVRLVPYELDGRVYLDIQQVLPLKEAADYQVKVRRKEAERERAHTSGKDFTKYHIIVDGAALPEQNKRNAMRTMIEQLVQKGVDLKAIAAQMPKSRFRVVDGAHESSEDVELALMASFPGMDVGRWFIDRPLVDRQHGKTYVVSKMWGLQTEKRLERLVSAFPESGITFKRSGELEQVP
jgi:hypothetical protein